MEAEATTVRSPELVGEAGAVAFSEGSWLGAFPVSDRNHGPGFYIYLQ